MKYKNNILGFTAVAVVVVLAVTSVLTCVNIIGSDKHISMYDNDPQKMIADNFPFSEHLKKVGIISNEILSDNIVNNVYSNGKMLLPVNSETNTQGLKKTVDDINIISSMDPNDVNLTDTLGFDVLSGISIFPHYTNKKSALTDTENEERLNMFTNAIINFSKTVGEVIAIPEEDAIYVDNNSIEFLGKRPYFTFKDGIMEKYEIDDNKKVKLR